MADHSLRLYESMLDLLPNADNPTPLVRLNRVLPFKHATVYGKLEWYNPFGAVKDRVAANMIRDAEEQGVLGPKRRLVEPTSGNTGMGLAMIANAKGYSLTVTVSNEIPEEKRAALRLFGADVRELADDLCPAPGAPEGAIALASEIATEPGVHQLNQYKNQANPDAHYRTTGPEIWRQTSGKVTHFVAGLGTCGTITGTGRFLKQQNAGVRVLGVHPADGHDIPGVRSIRQLKQTELFAPKEYDALVEVSNEEAFRMAKRLNQEESIVAGPSSGMALAGALKLVPDEPGVVCVVVFPDNAFKYTSSMRKHLPELYPNAPVAGNGAQATSAMTGAAGEVVNAIVQLARRSSDVLDVGDVEQLVDGGCLIIDVRSRAEFDEQHIASSINIPLEELQRGAPASLKADRSSVVVTVCNIGEKSLYGMLLLKAVGFEKAKNLMGGLNAWIAEGLPTEST
jgi:cysteine synthase/rhodanese-related sulfurtransferase